MNYPNGGFAIVTDRVTVTGSAVDSVEAQCHGSIWTEIKVVTLQLVKLGMFAKIRRSFSPCKIRQVLSVFTFVTSAKLNTSVRHFYKKHSDIHPFTNLPIGMKKLHSIVLQSQNYECVSDNRLF